MYLLPDCRKVSIRRRIKNNSGLVFAYGLARER
nr:MAG TPA: hypothetical protein [Caudoviricetes sp.]